MEEEPLMQILLNAILSFSSMVTLTLLWGQRNCSLDFRSLLNNSSQWGTPRVNSILQPGDQETRAKLLIRPILRNT